MMTYCMSSPMPGCHIESCMMPSDSNVVALNLETLSKRPNQQQCLSRYDIMTAHTHPRCLLPDVYNRVCITDK